MSSSHLTYFRTSFSMLQNEPRPSAAEEAFQRLVEFARSHAIDEIDAMVMGGDFASELPELDDNQGSPKWERWRDMKRAIPGDRRNAVLAEGNDDYVADTTVPPARPKKK